MSQMKRVLDVVEDLRSLADSIAALAGAASEESPEQLKTPTGATRPAEEPTEAKQPLRAAEVTEQEQPSAPTKQLSVAELRAFVAERSTPENRPKIRAILVRYGVAKLTDLPVEQYSALIAEVDAL